MNETPVVVCLFCVCFFFRIIGCLSELVDTCDTVMHVISVIIFFNLIHKIKLN